MVSWVLPLIWNTTFYTTWPTERISIKAPYTLLYQWQHYNNDAPASLYISTFFQWPAAVCIATCGDSRPTPTCLNLLQGWAPSTRSSSPATPACAALPCRWSATSRSWTTTARRKPTTRRFWRRAGWEPSIWRSWCPAWWRGWSTITTLIDSVAKVTEGILNNERSL